MVKASASGSGGRGLKSRPRQTKDVKIGTVAAIPLDDWHYGKCATTGWPGVSILRLGENFGCVLTVILCVSVR